MAKFTMAEFIEQNKLGVDVSNPHAAKMIQKKLLDSGFRQIREMHNGKRQNVWTNEGSSLEELARKLASLKL